MSTPETFTVFNPATGKPVADVPVSTPNDLELGCSIARKAQARWAATPVAQRAAIMMRLHDLLLSGRDHILSVIQSETGVNRRSAFTEVAHAAVCARHYGKTAAHLLADMNVSAALPWVTSTHVERHPIGLVGIIPSSASPFALVLGEAIAALLAGNAVVVCPGEATPLTALAAEDLLEKAGLPKGLFLVAAGNPKDLDEVLVAQCDFVSFTGARERGLVLAGLAAANSTGFSGEYGGKNPLIITSTADVTAAAQGAINGCFAHSGQVCFSLERIICHVDVIDDFLAEFVRLTQKLSVRHDKRLDTDMGSVLSAAACSAIDDFVQDAVIKGARVVAGGKKLGALGPAFYAPTILTRVPDDALIAHSVVGGPVVTIEPYTSDEEAVALANSLPFGLNACVWGKPAHARKIATQLEFGTVSINEAFASLWSSIAAPQSGWKQSGFGVRFGDDGFLKFTKAKTMASQRVFGVQSSSRFASNMWAQGVLSWLKFTKRHR